MHRDVFHAIADPNRRKIIQLLSADPLPVNDIAAKFSISRPAVSKHLRVLNQCGVVRYQKEGRRRLCHIEPEKLKEVSDWVNRYRRFWSRKLDALEDLLTAEEQMNAEEQKSQPKFKRKP